MLRRPVYVLIAGVALLLLASLVLVHGVGAPSNPLRGSIQAQSDFAPHTGTFKIVDPVTEQCRQITFSNVTAEIIETRKSCGPESSSRSGGRLDVIKRSFLHP
jgi:hypothetical protein